MPTSVKSPPCKKPPLTSVKSPKQPHALRGVYDEDLIDKVANLMRMIGIRRGMVVHGLIDGLERGMDEISACGETMVLEFDERGETRYAMYPEKFGLKRHTFEEIRFTGDLEKEKRRFIEVLQGKGSRACVEFTAINSGAIIYLADKVKDIKAGIETSLEAIYYGKAYQKYQEWREYTKIFQKFA